MCVVFVVCAHMCSVCMCVSSVHCSVYTCVVVCVCVCVCVCVVAFCMLHLVASNNYLYRELLVTYFMYIHNSCSEQIKEQLDSALAEKHNLKQLIHKYEADFLQEHGR